MKQRKELYLFLGRTALYFLIFLGLLYFFSYLGQGQGSFIYRDIDITKAIKEDLTDIMMSYMMPSKFLYRDSLPLTPNGKIDIKGLINEVNKR